jgi:response regulator RpfG family c-di-GMP phosphodiesterase
MNKADILIVDDDPQITNAIYRILKQRHFTIYSAQNGADALNLLAEMSFKLVISDIKMSGMHGFELLDKIQEIAPKTTRIVLSGHADVELILKLVNEKGIDRYMVKPWDNKDLALAVRKCIELYDLRMLAN